MPYGYLYTVNRLGSKASRKPSPINVIITRIQTIATVIEERIQGASLKVAIPTFKSSPQLGVGGLRPYPRKSKDVRLEIPPEMAKGSEVKIITIMLGII